MKNLNNLSMMVAVAPGIQWTGDDESRFHVWLQTENGEPIRPYAVKVDRPMGHKTARAILYRNPPTGGKWPNGTRECRYLNATAGANQAIVSEALRRAESEGMLEQAIALKEQGERDAATARRAAEVEKYRRNLTELTALDTADLNSRRWAADLLECDDLIILEIGRAFGRH